MEGCCDDGNLLRIDQQPVLAFHDAQESTTKLLDLVPVVLVLRLQEYLLDRFR